MIITRNERFTLRIIIYYADGPTNRLAPISTDFVANPNQLADQAHEFFLSGALYIFLDVNVVHSTFIKNSQLPYDKLPCRS